MDELISRLPEEYRIYFSNQLQDKLEQFRTKLEKKILKYINGEFERNRIPKAFKEKHENMQEIKQREQEQITLAKDLVKGVSNNSSNTALAAISSIGNLVGTAAEQIHQREITLMNEKEADEQLKAAKLSLHLPEERAPLIKSAVYKISYHYQLLLLRIEPGPEGITKLVNFMAESIKSFALDKLLEDPNQINCLVDAAIPDFYTGKYHTVFPSLTEKGFYKILKIDKKINDKIELCGPAVQALLGSYKTENYYSIYGALNLPFIVNAQCEIHRGTNKNSDEQVTMNSQNPYPVILVASNEKTSHIGLEYVTTDTDDIIKKPQLNVLQRLVPNFLIEELNHDINVTIETPSDKPADRVHPDEKNEFIWSLERRVLWKERLDFIKEYSKHLSAPIIGSMGSDLAGKARKKAARIFDAKQAVSDVKKMLKQTDLTLGELNAIRGSDAHSELANQQKIMKEKLATKILYLVLSIKLLINATEELEKSDKRKNNYFNLAIKGLRDAKHAMEATRDVPLTEFNERESKETQTKYKKNIFKLWQKHLYYCNRVLDITVRSSLPLQQSAEIRKLINNRDSTKINYIKKLRKQAIIQSAHSDLLMEQMEIINKYSAYDLETSTFPKPQRKHLSIGKSNIHSPPPRKMHTQPSSHFRRTCSFGSREEQPDDDFTFSLENRAYSSHALSDSKHQEENQKSLTTLCAAFSDSSTKEGFSSIEMSTMEARKSSSLMKETDNISAPKKSAPSIINSDNTISTDRDSPVDEGDIKLNPEELITAQRQPTHEQSIDTVFSMANIVHRLGVNKNDRMEKRLDKIKILTEGIKYFKNGIFSSLAIDEIEGNTVFEKRIEKRLTKIEHKIALSAQKINSEALENQQTAQNHKKWSMKFRVFSSRKNDARMIVKNCERVSVDLIQQVISSQSLLNQMYLSNHSLNHLFAIAQISWTLQQFQTVIKPALLSIRLHGESEWVEQIKEINLLSQKIENNMEAHNLTAIKAAYTKQTNQLKGIRLESLSTLNDALQHAQIIKNCNRKIIHLANGERTALVSSEEQTQQLNEDIEKITDDINRIEKLLLNLTQNSQTGLDIPYNQEQSTLLLESEKAQETIKRFIKGLRKPQGNLKPSSQLVRCESLVVGESTINTIQLELIEKVHELINLSCESSHQDKVYLINRVEGELYANADYLPPKGTYINWGVWIINIAARTCAQYHEEQLKFPKAPLGINIKEKLTLEKSKTSAIMLETRKLILESYQRLDYAMQKPEVEMNETLTTDQDWLNDELEWAGQLNIDELQAMGKTQIITKACQSELSLDKYEKLKHAIESKPNPSKSIYYQFIAYCALEIKSKKNTIKKLNGYLNQLRKDNHFFMSLCQNNPLKDIMTDKITSLNRSIEKRLAIEMKEKSIIHDFDKELTSRLTKLRIFFNDWKYKVRDIYPVKTVTSALKEATIIKNKIKQHKRELEILKKEKAQKDEITNELSIVNTIEDLSIDDIDELFQALQEEILSITRSQPILKPAGMAPLQEEVNAHRSASPTRNRSNSPDFFAKAQQEAPKMQPIPLNETRISNLSESRFFKKDTDTPSPKKSLIPRMSPSIKAKSDSKLHN